MSTEIPRRAWLCWLLPTLVSLASCGHTPARSGAAGAAGSARAAPAHDHYEVIVRTRVSFAGEELTTLRTRLDLHVRERAASGIRVLARVRRDRSVGASDAAFSDVDVRLDARGTLTHDPLSLCPDPDIDDLSPTRMVRHVLGSLAPRDGDESLTLSADVAELDAVATARYGLDDEGALLVRAEGRGRVARFDAASWHFELSERARLRSIQHLHANDAFHARMSLLLEAAVHATDPNGRTRDGPLEVRTDVISRAAESTAASPEPCRAGPATAIAPRSESEFDVQAVIRLINTRRGAITRCYERELLRVPMLAGRVAITMTIQESGAVTGVRAIEDTVGSDAVAACVVDVISGFRFSPGPVGGSVTYSFPFIFEPTAGPVRVD